MSYSRFAIYYVPPKGALAAFGSNWLGWDVEEGTPSCQPDVPGLRDITMTPRKYGFHGTLKPPFRLKDSMTELDLRGAIETLAGSLKPALCEGLELKALGHFLALTPYGETDGLQRVAAACVADLDALRAAPNAAELARRRAAGLSPRQEALLMEWGYPYVMEEFRFHLTLSGRLTEPQLRAWTQVLSTRIPALPTPFVVDQIALCGERLDGHFELIQRYTLAG